MTIKSSGEAAFARRSATRSALVCRHWTSASHCWKGHTPSTTKAANRHAGARAKDSATAASMQTATNVSSGRKYQTFVGRPDDQRKTPKSAVAANIVVAVKTLRSAPG